MTLLYQVSLTVHALVAVLGIGQVVAIAFLAADAQSAHDRLPATLAMMGRLARITSISLGFMFLSGLALMIPTGGAYAATWWFPSAFVLFIVLGAVNGMLQRALRASGGPPSEASTRAVARLSPLALTMCGLVTVIVILMVAKPF